MVSQERKKKLKDKERYESRAKQVAGKKKEHYEKNKDVLKLSAKSRFQQDKKAAALNKRQVLKRYNTDKEYRQNCIISSSKHVKDKYRNDETFRLRIINSASERVKDSYKNDETYRLRAIKSTSIKRNTKYRENEEYRQNYIRSVSERVKDKYKNDETYRLRAIKSASIKRNTEYRENEEYRQNYIRSVSIRRNIKYRENKEFRRNYINSVSWKQRTKYRNDPMYQRNHIDKVTAYNMLKRYRGIDFSLKEQRRKRSNKVIKFYKNFYRSRRLTKKHEETSSYHSTLPELTMRCTPKKRKIYPSKKVKKSQSQAQTSAKSLNMSCFISQSNHNSVVANNRQSRFFVRNYRQRWAYKSRTVAKMNSDLENLNTIFDMYKKNKRKYSIIELKLLLEKANAVINISSNSLAKLHASIHKQCSKFLEHLPKSVYVPDVAEFTLAMGNVREHFVYNEAYHLESVYKIFDVNHCLRCGHTGDLYTAIPIDEEGRAVFFDYGNNQAVEVGNRCLCVTTTQNEQDNETGQSFPNFVSPFLKRLVEGSESQSSTKFDDEEWNTNIQSKILIDICQRYIAKDLNKNTDESRTTEKNSAVKSRLADKNHPFKWKCHQDLCKFEPIDIEMCHILFCTISEMNKEDSLTDSLVELYLDKFNYCTNQSIHPDKMGHSIYCHPRNGCYSFLRALRALAPHFPVLANFVRILYKAIERCRLIRDVKTIRSQGSIAQLRSIVESMFLEPMRPRVSTEESEIMNIFWKNIMKAAEIRDE